MDLDAKHPDARILIIDDDPTLTRLFADLLESAGYRAIVTLNQPSDFSRVFVEVAPDLVLLDLNMPQMSGFEILAWIRALGSNGFMPVLVLTGDATLETKRRALAAGAKDFLTKPPDMMETLLRIDNLLETRSLHRALESQNAELEIQVQERTRALREALGDLARLHGDLRASHEDTVRRLAAAAELRDGETALHLQRIGAYAATLASAAGFDEAEAETLRLAAPMHDIGKICVPDRVLMKRSVLTGTEYAIMKTHADIGRRILEGSESPLLRTAATIAWTHHEHWNGRGYPRGMAGEEIPIVGRVVAIADAFDSMTSARRYREAVSRENAIELMEANGGTQFDPELIKVFASAIGDLQTIALP